MSQKFEIDDKTRFLVLYLDAEMKPSRISRILNRPERTVRDWAEKTEEGKDIREVQKGRGRQSKLSKIEQKRILRQTKQTPQKATTRRLAAKNDLEKSAIHRLVIQKCLKYKGLKFVQELTSKQKSERIDYCLEMTEGDGQKIYQTFYSDEMGIRLSDIGKTKAWQEPGKKIEMEIEYEDVKLNCWAAVSLRGATTLEIFKENLKGITYQNILGRHIQEMNNLYPTGFFFIHDNHQSHTYAHDYLKNMNLERIKLPSYSPDLNVIENLWFTLKDSVAREAPHSEAALRRSLHNNWEILTTPQNLRPYFESLHTRYFECIEEEGRRLPY